MKNKLYSGDFTKSDHSKYWVLIKIAKFFSDIFFLIFSEAKRISYKRCSKMYYRIKIKEERYILVESYVDDIITLGETEEHIRKIADRFNDKGKSIELMTK